MKKVIIINNIKKLIFAFNLFFSSSTVKDFNQIRRHQFAIPFSSNI